MPVSRKNKKRMAIYSVGAASAVLRTGISTAYYVTKFGIKTGELLSELVIGSSMALADGICGVQTKTNVGGELCHGLSAVLCNAADFTGNTLNRSISSFEKYAKKKIQHMR